jgi:hypothetical protein
MSAHCTAPQDYQYFRNTAKQSEFTILKKKEQKCYSKVGFGYAYRPEEKLQQWFTSHLGWR